jgi:hypothetical protein
MRCRSLETLPSDLRDYAAGDAVLGVLLLRCADSDFGERQVSTADHTDRPDQFALCAQFLSRRTGADTLGGAALPLGPHLHYRPRRHARAAFGLPLYTAV